jgi:hypothetical protein
MLTFFANDNATHAAKFFHHFVIVLHPLYFVQTSPLGSGVCYSAVGSSHDPGIGISLRGCGLTLQ